MASAPRKSGLVGLALFPTAPAWHADEGSAQRPRQRMGAAPARRAAAHGPALSGTGGAAAATIRTLPPAQVRRRRNACETCSASGAGRGAARALLCCERHPQSSLFCSYPEWWWARDAA